MRPDAHDAGFLYDMLRYSEKASQMLAETGAADFSGVDFKTRMAIERCIEIVGEAARHVSEGFVAAHPEIPWTTIVGQRNRLVHDYFEIDVERIERVVRMRLPELIAQLRPLVPKGPPDPEPE